MRGENHPKPTTSWWFIVMFCLAALVFGGYIVYTDRGIQLIETESSAQAYETAAKSVQKIEIDDTAPLTVPLSLLAANQPYMYVSKSSSLSETYQPTTLETVTVLSTNDGGTLQLRSDVDARLEQLFAAATHEGYSLMVSSAYRSISDQQKLFDDFVKTKGEALAKEYVLTPGASEHHTGYAVDVTDASASCKVDSDKCNLSPASAAWLADNAPAYGFIIRYPSGKEPITGIAHEPWHLRYVGKALATRLSDSGISFDEFIEQIAPGRVR